MTRAERVAAHAAFAAQRIAGSDLLIGGVPLSELAARVGRTPFYAYDAAAIAARIDRLRTMLPPAVRLHYAIKANPMAALVGRIVPCVDGFDVASRGEMLTALNAGMPPGKISLAGPGKTDGELAAAAGAGITIHVESEREIPVLAELGARLGRRPRLALRVNPDFQLKSSGMKMGGGPQQFGIDAERVPEVLAQIDLRRLDFAGFHIFAGSQNLNAAAIIEAQNLSVELAERLAQASPAPVRELNIGGGFGIPYFPGDQPLALEPVAANLAALVQRVARSLPGAELILELGRYLVGEAGYYVCRVIDRKVSRGQVFLVTDGGLHHHLAASGNFGQVIRKNYPVVIGTRMDAEPTELASVVGPLCTPLDVLADSMRFPRADVGDLVVVLQSGAYGYSASPHGFLSHPEPAEILV